MQTTITIILVALLIFVVVRKMIPPKGVSQITTKDLSKDIKLNKTKKQYIDVRTPGEYQGNHIKGFKNLPLQTLGSKIGELDKGKEVVVICQSGGRSMAATRILKKNGFEQVTNVQGGMSSWRG